MRRDDAVRVGRLRRVGLRRAVRAAREAAVDQRAVLVRRVAVGSMPIGVDAVDGVAAVRVVGGREAPVAVAGDVQAVVDLGARRSAGGSSPQLPGAPALLGHEQGGISASNMLPPQHGGRACPVRVGALEHATGRSRCGSRRPAASPGQAQSQLSGNVRQGP